MNWLIYGLGDSSKNSTWSSLNNKNSGGASASGSGMSILSFISVCKDITNKVQPNTQIKARILEALFKSNEDSRSYYLEEKAKQLFSRCLRLFFFY